MVWQDFLFACASYPTYPEYLVSIEDEARANMRLLRHHPSIVIYAGNNEDYQIQQTYNLTYDYDNDKNPESWLKYSFPARYIYEYLLPKVVEEECPGLPYHPSSPWGGGKHTTDPTIGDIHQWDGKLFLHVLYIFCILTNHYSLARNHAAIPEPPFDGWSVC